MKKTIAAAVVAASLALGSSHVASAGTNGETVAISSEVSTVAFAQNAAENSKGINDTAGKGENLPGSSFFTVWNVLLGVFTLGSLGAIITTILEKAGVLDFLKR